METTHTYLGGGRCIGCGHKGGKHLECRINGSRVAASRAGGGERIQQQLRQHGARVDLFILQQLQRAKRHEFDALVVLFLHVQSVFDSAARAERHQFGAKMC